MIDIKAVCKKCGKEVGVEQGEKAILISSHDKCKADVKVTWKDGKATLLYSGDTIYGI